MSLLPEQIRHEEAIAAAQRALAVTRNVTQQRAYAELLVSLIRSRDPAVTRQFESARMRRVGL